MISNEELLALDVDVLAPCALENQIRQANAADVKAQLIVEGANGPTTAGADKILREKGIIVVPDILANGGGVTVSYMEWTQNRFGYYYAEDEINKRADRSMSRAFENVWAVGKSTKFRCASPPISSRWRKSPRRFSRAAIIDLTSPEGVTPTPFFFA